MSGSAVAEVRASSPARASAYWPAAMRVAARPRAAAALRRLRVERGPGHRRGAGDVALPHVGVDQQRGDAGVVDAGVAGLVPGGERRLVVAALRVGGAEHEQHRGRRGALRRWPAATAPPPRAANRRARTVPGRAAPAPWAARPRPPAPRAPGRRSGRPAAASSRRVSASDGAAGRSALAIAASTGGVEHGVAAERLAGRRRLVQQAVRRAGDLEQRVARRLAAGDPIGGGDGEAVAAADEPGERRLDRGEERMALGDVEVHRQRLGGIALRRQAADHLLALADQPDHAEADLDVGLAGLARRGLITWNTTDRRSSTRNASSRAGVASSAPMA